MRKDGRDCGNRHIASNCYHSVNGSERYNAQIAAAAEMFALTALYGAAEKFAVDRAFKNLCDTLAKGGRFPRHEEYQPVDWRSVES